MADFFHQCLSLQWPHSGLIQPFHIQFRLRTWKPDRSYCHHKTSGIFGQSSQRKLIRQRKLIFTTGCALPPCRCVSGSEPQMLETLFPRDEIYYNLTVCNQYLLPSTVSLKSFAYHMFRLTKGGFFSGTGEINTGGKNKPFSLGDYVELMQVGGRQLQWEGAMQVLGQGVHRKSTFLFTYKP